MVLDLEDHILDINPVGADILGIAKESLINQSLFNFLERKPEFLNGLDLPVSKTPLIVIPQLLLMTRSKTKPISVNFLAFEIQITAYSGSLLQFRDISRRKQAEANLEIAQETTRSILETLQDSYFEADSAGIITYVNRAFLEATRYPNRDDLVGKHFRHIVSRMSLRNFYNNFIQIFEQIKLQSLLNSSIEPKTGLS